MRRGKRNGNAAGFNRQHDIRHFLAEMIRQIAAHIKHKARVQTVIEEHVHFDNMLTNTLALAADRFAQFVHLACASNRRSVNRTVIQMIKHILP